MSETSDVTVPELTLGWRMQMSMRKAGISRGDIADRLGVTGSTVGRWMSDKDKTGVKRIYLERWAELCSVPYQWLVGELFNDPTDEGAVPQPRRRASDINRDSTENPGRYQDASLARQERCVTDLLLATG